MCDNTDIVDFELLRPIQTEVNIAGIQTEGARATVPSVWTSTI